jgi:hypothetical protein
VIDLIELAGLWIGIPDWDGLSRTLRRLLTVLETDFPSSEGLRQALDQVLLAAEQAQRGEIATEDVRRRYLRAIR